MPPQELENIVCSVLPKSINNYLGLVLGSSDGHTKGKDHINMISSHSGCPLDQFLVIGDDYADYELSAVAGVDCILVNRRGLTPQKGISMVLDLNIVKNWLS